MTNDPSPNPKEVQAYREDILSGVRSRLRYWLTFSGILIPGAVAVVFAVTWFVRWDRLPVRVTLTTAAERSSYHVFGEALCGGINRQVGRHIASAQTSTGSGENVELVAMHDSTMAMYQGGSVDLPDNVSVVAPLYREVVHVIVRKEVLSKHVERELSYELLRDLLVVQRRRIYAGKQNSGMRLSALEILDHYGFSKQDLDQWETFTEDEPADIVISTTGMFSQKMADRLRANDFVVLSLQADAIAHRWSYFVEHEIPRGFYRDREFGPVPDRPVRTVATTAFLIAPREASAKLVRTCLSVLYKTGITETTKHLDLIQRDEARTYLHGMPVHEAADEFYSPLDVGYLASVMDSIVASKDLTLAVFAGIYLLWNLRSRALQRRRQAETDANRARLDEYVDETIAIESEQINVTDPSRLEHYLDKVTRIKLRALNELTDEGLRGDPAFSIFLLQCANLTNKIQLKIITYAPNQD